MEEAAAQQKAQLLVVPEENDNCLRAHARRSQPRRARVGRGFELLAADRSPRRSEAKELLRPAVADFRN
ncbi:MAG TPA: hypothetical protein VFP82_00245 [Chthoniobacterales bacterium]|nr:hypothetical protein [Chthoniobacterales bacterium]